MTGRLLGSLTLALTSAACLLVGCLDSAESSAPAQDAVFPEAASPDSTAVYASSSTLRLPPFSLPTLHGARLTRDDVRDTSLVLHFWAPWSQPSLNDLPLFDSLGTYLEHAGVQVLGVLEPDGDLTAARSIVDSLQLAFPILVDENGQLAVALEEITMLPTTLFIGRDGAVVERRVGAFSSAEQLRIQLRYLTESGPVPPPLASETPQAHALTPDRARALVVDGAAVYDVRDPAERLTDDPLTSATPAPLATLVPEQLPSDPLVPLLFVGDTLGTRAQLAAEQALAWGHRRVYFAGGDLSGLFGSALDG
ncbi:MAG: redoxin domain-containing protein [Bacteroidota bacterium]